MIDVALFHVKTSRAGEPGYYAPRPRGHLEVWHDSRRYLYDLRGSGVRGAAARAFITSAWDLNQAGEIKGRWPSYTVERDS